MFLITKGVLETPKALSEDGFSKFLNAQEYIRDKLILLLLKDGGFRPGELLSIKLEDIDFVNQSVKVVSGYSNDRIVHLSSDLMALINNY